MSIQSDGCFTLGILLISNIFNRKNKYKNMDGLYSGSSSVCRHFLVPACFRVGFITPPDSHSNRWRYTDSMWSLTVKVIRYITRGDETGQKINKIILFYRYRERQDIAHCAPKLNGSLYATSNQTHFSWKCIFIELQMIEYEDWAMHR